MHKWPGSLCRMVNMSRKVFHRETLHSNLYAMRKLVENEKFPFLFNLLQIKILFHHIRLKTSNTLLDP